MRRLITARRALKDPDWLGGLYGAPSFAVMRTLLIASMGERLTEAEMAIFTQVTGRTETPGEAVDELWVIAGRRSGKSRSVATLAAYLAACVDYRSILGPGERGVLPIVAASTLQAGVVLNFIKGIFTEAPRFAALVENITADSDVARQTAEIGSAMRILTMDQLSPAARARMAGKLKQVGGMLVYDDDSPPDGSSLTTMTAAPLPATQRGGYTLVFQGSPGREHFAEIVDDCYCVFARDADNGDISANIPENSSGRSAIGGAAVQKGPVGSAQSERPTGSAYVDAATRNKMGPRRHVLFPGGQVPKIAADALKKIRAADDDAKRRARDVAEFYAKGKP